MVLVDDDVGDGRMWKGNEMAKIDGDKATEIVQWIHLMMVCTKRITDCFNHKIFLLLFPED